MTVFQPRQSDRLREAQIGKLEVLLARIGDYHGIIFRTQESRFEVLLVLPLAVPLGSQNVSRDLIAWPHLFCDDRSKTGKLHRRIRAMAGHSVVSGLWVV